MAPDEQNESEAEKRRQRHQQRLKVLEQKVLQRASADTASAAGEAAHGSQATSKSPSNQALVDHEALKQQLRDGDSQVFVGESAALLMPMIKAYDPESDDYILQAAASISFLNNYIQQAKQQAADLETEYPLDVRQLAQQICNRFYNHSKDMTQNLKERIIQTEIWLCEGVYRVTPTHWLDLYNKSIVFELQQQLAVIAVERLEIYIETGGKIDYDKAHRKMLHAIAKLFAISYGPQSGQAKTETLQLLITRLYNVLQWFDADSELVAPQEFSNPRAHVAQHWQQFRALGFESFEAFAMSSVQALVVHLSLDKFKQRDDAKDKAIIIRAACIRLSSSDKFSAAHCHHLYAMVRYYVEQPVDLADLAEQEDFVSVLKYLLIGHPVQATEASLRSNLRELEADLRDLLVYVLRIVFEYESPETFEGYDTLYPVYELLTIDGKLDQTPKLMIDHSRGHQFLPQHYYARKFDDLLTLEHFQRCSLRTRPFIVRAVLLRLTRKRLDADCRFTAAMCESYSLILDESSHGQLAGVQEIISWFDRGEVCCYPRWWLETAPLRAICNRAINYEFAGQARLFYRSQHHLFRFIFGREQPTSEDTRLLVEIAIERLAHYTHLHQGCPALADKHFSADHRAQLLSLLFSNDESVFLLQCYHDRACDVVEPLNPDALSATWIQSSKGQLLQFFVHSKDVGQCLTKAKYVKACHEDQWLFAQAALARLQYGALVDAVHYSPQQLAEYLRIVISANLNLLAENCSFTTAAEKMINCYCFGADEGSAFFNNIEQIKKEKQFCRVEVVPTIDEYLQCDDAGRRQQLCEAGLGGWAIKFITDYVTGQRQYLQQAQMLPSPKDRASVIKAIVSEDFWVEKVCLAHPQMCVIIAIIKSYLATPSFQGDTLAIEALLNHFTPDGYYDHRFIMYKNAVERRFSGEAVDFIAHQPDIKEDKVEGSWQFEGPNVITSFLAKNHFDQGSVERKLLFLKAMVCLCERVSCSPDASYIELMYEAASDAMLIQRLQQESDLLPRMTGILTKAGKEITAHIVESQSVDFEYSDEWAPEGHAGVTLFSRASEPPPGLGGASADYKM